MSRYLLDTNIISSVTKPAPPESLLAWMAGEVRRGVLEKPAGRKRDQLEAWFAGTEGPSALFAGRVLPFDEKAALVWARLMAEGKAYGRSRSALDTIIAAIAEVNECIIVTNNEKDFIGVETFNPLRNATR